MAFIKFTTELEMEGNFPFPCYKASQLCWQHYWMVWSSNVYSYLQNQSVPHPAQKLGDLVDMARKRTRPSPGDDVVSLADFHQHCIYMPPLVSTESREVSQLHSQNSHSDTVTREELRINCVNDNYQSLYWFKVD